eukprot:2751686-Pleurochrysis_carterae.AAC.3
MQGSADRVKEMPSNHAKSMNAVRRTRGAASAVKFVTTGRDLLLADAAIPFELQGTLDARSSKWRLGAHERRRAFHRGACRSHARAPCRPKMDRRGVGVLSVGKKRLARRVVPVA